MLTVTLPALSLCALFLGLSCFKAVSPYHRVDSVLLMCGPLGESSLLQQSHSLPWWISYCWTVVPALQMVVMLDILHFSPSPVKALFFIFNLLFAPSIQHNFPGIGKHTTSTFCAEVGFWLRILAILEIITYFENTVFSFLFIPDNASSILIF